MAATVRKRPKNPNIDLGSMAADLAQSQQPSVQQLSQQDADAVTAAKHPGGRPKNAVPTAKMVVYLSKENVKRVKHFAVEHETQYSKVIDALVSKYLDDLEI